MIVISQEVVTTIFVIITIIIKCFLFSPPSYSGARYLGWFSQQVFSGLYPFC